MSAFTRRAWDSRCHTVTEFPCRYARTAERVYVLRYAARSVVFVGGHLSVSPIYRLTNFLYVACLPVLVPSPASPARGWERLHRSEGRPALGQFNKGNRQGRGVYAVARAMCDQVSRKCCMPYVQIS